MSFSEPYDESFKSPEPLDEASIETYAMQLLRATFPQIVNIPISQQEKDALQRILRQNSEQDVEAIRVRMLYLKAFFEYTNPNISPEEKALIQIEMDKRRDLKDFIERRYLATLVDAYIMWREGLRLAETDEDVRASLDGFELSPDDAFELFKLLEQYPDVVEERLKAASAIVEQGPHANSAVRVIPDENLYKEEYLKMLALKKFFNQTITPEGQAYLDKAFKNDPRFKMIAEKIQRAML